MAIFDTDQQRIIVRIVYDGLASAGKTTNLKQLCSFFTTLRRSELYVPMESENGRTLYFDWLQLEGGLVGGHRLRCQLLTVPGQMVLARRRSLLLKTADVVVLVCDSTPEGIQLVKRDFDVLRSYLHNKVGAEVPIIVQANKQDLEGALSPEEISQELDLPSDIPVVPARASEGIGVKETTVLAIRAAANKIQKILLDYHSNSSIGFLEAFAGTAETGEEFYRSLLDMESRFSSNNIEAELKRDYITPPYSTDETPKYNLPQRSDTAPYQVYPRQQEPMTPPASVPQEPTSHPASPSIPTLAVLSPVIANEAAPTPAQGSVTTPEPTPETPSRPLYKPSLSGDESAQALRETLSTPEQPERSAPSPEATATPQPEHAPEAPHPAPKEALAGASSFIPPEEPTAPAGEPHPGAQNELREASEVSIFAEHLKAPVPIEVSVPPAALEALGEPARLRAAEPIAAITTAPSIELHPPPLTRSPQAPREEPPKKEERAAAIATAEAPAPKPAAPTKITPPLPRVDVSSGMIWPVPRGREILRQVPVLEARLREDLIAPPGGEDGSGHSDAFIYEASGWCLKTSLRRRFALLESGRAALLMLARAKMLLGPMLLPNTVLSVQQDSSGGAWLWTTTPWLTSLRGEMSLAAKQGDEQELARGLRAFAGAAINAMLMVSRSGISLDIHPSNFCVKEGQAYYLDDDISMSQNAPGIGYALLYRIEEYLAFPGAIDAYLVALEEALLSKATQEDIEQLGLIEALSQTPLRASKGQIAIQQLIDVCKRCKRAGNASSHNL